MKIPKKPRIQKVKGRNGSYLYSCRTPHAVAFGETPSSAYDSWHALMVSIILDLEKKLIQAKAEKRKLAREPVSKQWMVERICHYNQKCIDHIWKTRTLPSLYQYIEWTGRRSDVGEGSRT